MKVILFLAVLISSQLKNLVAQPTSILGKWKGNILTIDYGGVRPDGPAISMVLSQRNGKCSGLLKITDANSKIVDEPFVELVVTDISSALAPDDVATITFKTNKGTKGSGKVTFNRPPYFQVSRCPQPMACDSKQH